MTEFGAASALKAEADSLSTILVDRRLLTGEDAENYLRIAKDENTFLEDVLLREKVFTRTQLLQILENYYFFPSAEILATPYNPAVLGMIPAKLAYHHMAFPYGLEGDALRVAFAAPDKEKAIDAIAQMAGRPVIAAVALRHDLKAVIEENYRRFQEETSLRAQPAPQPTAAAAQPQGKRRAILHLDFEAEDAVAIVNRIFKVAIQRNISDIHLQPAEKKFLIRFRLDDVMYTVAELGKSQEVAVISRMKILCGMDIAEHRLPQDGRYALREDDLLVDMRVSCIPSQFGEKIVIRLLRKNMNLLNLDNLRMPPDLRELYDECLTAPQGMFLVTGPTGSGKTTTLYATLAALDRESINVLTLEDPVEYTLENLTQVQIREEIGMTFSAGLRAFLRQDPDVILVGEIRDLETVEIACRAALTGHKVFSTLHTNDSCQAVTRLMDMGVAPYLLAATIKGILAQRLVRLTCSQCRAPYAPSPAELAYLGDSKVERLHRGAGCAACSGTGYKGRKAIYEYFKLDEQYHQLILERASPFALREAAQRRGMRLLPDQAKREVIEGETTVEEAQRAVQTEEARLQVCKGCGRTLASDFAACPYCKTALHEVCSGCGSRLEAGWTMCPKCGREVERAGGGFCPSCLAPVAADWKSCPYCGGRIR